MVRSRYDRVAWERRRKEPGTSVEVADRVQVPVDAATAWARVRAVEAAASCLPGLVPGSLHALGDGRFEAMLRQTALGVTATWRLQAELTPSEADRRLEVRLEGDEPRLGMRMRARATVAVEASDGAAVLDYRGDVRIDGRLAASGAPIVRGIVEETLRRFVDSLAGGETRRADGLLARLRQALRALMQR